MHRIKKVSLPVAINIGDQTFSRCSELKEINLPKANTIGVEAFYQCSSLKEIDLSLVNSIPQYTFTLCTELTKVNLPVATIIGADVFIGCNNLNAVILRTTEQVCMIDITAFVIEADSNQIPTKINDNFYVPASMFEQYREVYEPAFESAGFGGYFDIVFHKIEDYPEICN